MYVLQDISKNINIKKMSVKHLLIISFIFSAFIIRAQETKENNDLYSILLNNKTKFKINNLDINTKKQDFGTAYYLDKIVFTSSRTNSRFIRRVGDKNKLPFLDLYVAKQENLKLVNVKPFNKSINKKYHEGPASFNKLGTFMAFTRNNYGGKSKDDAVKLQLFTSEFKNKKWTEAKPVNFNSNEYSVAHPALTVDGKTMYFTSDMPGGFGGTDLYITRMDKNGRWSMPMNLGSEINTKKNEMFPFIHESGILFFASNGHGGLGGLDLFYVKEIEDKFTKPKNFGKPINSKDDDFAFILNKKMDAGYFSSNRKNKKGNDDIYSFTLLKNVIIDILLKGKVLGDSNKVLSKTNVILYNENGNKIKEVLTNETGEYNFTLHSNNIYKLEGVKEKYNTFSTTINSDINDTVIIKDIILEIKPEFNFICNVTNKGTKEAIANTKITINGNIEENEIVLNTNDKGQISMKLENFKLADNIKCTLTLEKEGYYKKTVNYSKILDKSGSYVLDVEMQKINILLKGRTIDDRNIILANTDVSLYDNSGNIIKTIATDKTGKYNFTLQANEVYKLEGKIEKHKTFSVKIDTHISDTTITKDIILNVIHEFNFICNVKDDKTKTEIANTKITIKDKINKKEVILYTDLNGAIIQKLKKNKLNDLLNYDIIFEKENYSIKNVNYKVTLDKEGEYVLNVKLKKVSIILKGKIFDDKKNILTNTIISLYDDNENKIKTITTNKKGEYSFTLQAGESYKLESKKEKYKTFSSIINSKADNPVIIQDFVLKKIPEFNIICNITNKETKEVIANAKITVSDKIKNKEEVLYSNKKGELFIKLENAKLNDHLNYTFSFKKEGFAKQILDYKKVLDKAGNYNLEIEMQRIDILLKGQTTDNKNNILANTNVTLYDNSGNKINTITTNENGEYYFTLKADKVYKLEGKKEKYKTYSLKIDSRTNKTLINQDIVLDLIPEFNIVCNVIAKETKRAIKNVKITVKDKNKNKEEVLYSDEKGELFLKLQNQKLKNNLNLSFIFKKEGYSKKEVDYKKVLDRAGNYNLKIEMQRIDILLKGQTTDNNNNTLANTYVTLYDDAGNKIKTITTNKSGKYNFTLQADKVYKLEGKKEKHKTYSSIIDTHTNDTIINQTLILEIIPEFNIICNLTAKETKKIIANTKITIKDKIKGTDNIVYTDERGKFIKKLKNLKLNDSINYTFIFEKNGYSKKEINYETVLNKAGDYILDIELQRLQIVLKGKAFDSDNNILANTEIRLYCGSGDKILLINTDDNGEYTFVLKPDNVFNEGEKYIINVELKGGLEVQSEIYKNLTKIPIINPIYFDYDKSNIRPEAKFELNKIVILMNQNPNMHIELSSYADSNGTSDYNLQLSKRRASASVNYIRRRITNPLRVTGKGFGEVLMENDNDSKVKADSNYSEEKFQKNRRTEFKIIK